MHMTFKEAIRLAPFTGEFKTERKEEIKKCLLKLDWEITAWLGVNFSEVRGQNLNVLQALRTDYVFK